MLVIIRGADEGDVGELQRGVGDLAGQVRGDAHSAEGVAMVGLPTGNVVYALRLARGEEVLAGEFEGRVHGLAAAGDEEGGCEGVVGEGEERGGEGFGGGGRVRARVDVGDAGELRGGCVQDGGMRVPETSYGGAAAGVEDCTAGGECEGGLMGGDDG